MRREFRNIRESIDVKRKSARFRCRAALAPMAIMFWASQAAANCEDLLGDRTYSCRVKSEGEAFSECFRFTSPGDLSANFDLSLDQFPGVLACDCKADGSFANPEFGESNSFHCVSGLTSPFGLAFDGDVKKKGRRIQGDGVNEGGSSFVFRCDRARTCVVPTLGAPAAAAWSPGGGSGP
jgi:hypothetical protein